MQSRELDAVYQSKTDEELLLLAGGLDQLTTEARSYLVGELARRRIEIPRGAPERDRCDPPDPRAAGSFRRMVVEDGKILGEVFKVYREHSSTFTKIMAPAVVISYLSIEASRWEGRAIVRHYSNQSDLLQSPGSVAAILLLGIAGYLLSWIAFSFSFGATSAVVDQIRGGFEPSVAECFREVRKHAGPVLAISVLLFLLVVLSNAAMSQVMVWASLRSRPYGIRLSGLSMEVLYYVLYAAIVLFCSRFSLAVPAIVLDDVKPGRAMFLSDELTEGKWTILAALIIKSVLGGYIAARFPYWIASLLPPQIWSVWWSPYLLIAAALGGVIAVEPLMFIGFTLLYLNTSAKGPIPEVEAVRAQA